MAEQLGPDRHITRLSGAGTDQDGQRIKFDLVTEDGTTHPFFASVEGISKLVEGLIRVAQVTASESGHVKKPATEVKISGSPVRAIELGVGRGKSKDEHFLIVHTGAFPLPFLLKSATLTGLRELLDQALKPAG